MSPPGVGCWKEWRSDKRIYNCVQKINSIQMGSVYKAQMLVSGHLLLFSIMRKEASTLEQSWIPIIPLSVAVKSTTALAGFLNITLHKSLYVLLKYAKGTLLLRRKTQSSAQAKLWFDSLLLLM